MPSKYDKTIAALNAVMKAACKWPEFGENGAYETLTFSAGDILMDSSKRESLFRGNIVALEGARDRMIEQFQILHPEINLAPLERYWGGFDPVKEDLLEAAESLDWDWNSNTASPVDKQLEALKQEPRARRMFNLANDVDADYFTPAMFESDPKYEALMQIILLDEEIAKRYDDIHVVKQLGLSVESFLTDRDNISDTIRDSMRRTHLRAMQGHLVKLEKILKRGDEFTFDNEGLRLGAGLTIRPEAISEKTKESLHRAKAGSELAAGTMRDIIGHMGRIVSNGLARAG